jgi:hypothetical protein
VASAGYEAPPRSKPRGSEFVARRLQRLFRSPSFGDVLDNALEVAEHALGVAHRPGVKRDFDHLAVLAIDLAFEPADNIVRLQQSPELGAPLRIDVDLPADVGDLGHELLGRSVTEHPRQRRIGDQEAALGRRLEDAFDGVLEDATVHVLGGFV